MMKNRRFRHLRIVRTIDRARLAEELRLGERPDRFRKVLFPNDWRFCRADLEALQEATRKRLEALGFFFSLRIGTRANVREYTLLTRQSETLDQLLSCFDALSAGKRTIRYEDDLEPLIAKGRGGR